MLLPHDVCWKLHLRRYGGFGYSFILEKFLPHLRNTGVSESDIAQMMVANPKTMLPFAAPGIL
jgi:phosphotriesterase-related protein